MDYVAYQRFVEYRHKISGSTEFSKVIQVITNNIDNSRVRIDIRCLKNNIRTEKGVVLSASEFKNILNNIKSKSYLIFSNENEILKRVHYMNFGEKGCHISTIRRRKDKTLHSIYLKASELEAIIEKGTELLQHIDAMQ